jgi:LysM repeat protein
VNNVARTLENVLRKINLPHIRTRLPHVPLERASLIAYLLIAAFALGNLGLGVLVLAPTFEKRATLTAQVQSEQQNLLRARQLREESPETLETRIASYQAIVQRVPTLFLDKAQLAALGNAIYQNANLSGIALTEFSLSGGPEDASVLKLYATPTITPTLRAAVKPTTKPISTSKTPTATVTTPTPIPLALLYQTRTLHLQAQGTSQRLVNFMARLRELEVSGITISRLDMRGKAEWSMLTLDLTLFVNPNAGAKRPVAQAVNNVNPVLVPTRVSPTAPASSPTPFVLIVPYGSSGTPPTLTPTPESVYIYVAQSGDTLFTLAEKFHVPAQEIVNRNALTILELQPGQKLVIPVR